MIRVINLFILVAIGVIIADLLANPGGGTGTLFGGMSSIWSQSVGGMLGQKVNVPSIDASTSGGANTSSGGSVIQGGNPFSPVPSSPPAASPKKAPPKKSTPPAKKQPPNHVKLLPCPASSCPSLCTPFKVFGQQVCVF